MGYRSDITIVCGRRAYAMLHEVCEEQDFLPKVKTEGEFLRLCWYFVKWDDTSQMVEEVNQVLDELDRLGGVDEKYAYKQFVFGEDDGDIEVRCNAVGIETLEGYYVSREVVYADSTVEDEKSFLGRKSGIEMKNVQVQYLDDTIERLRYIEGKSDWIDLRAAEEFSLKAGEFKLIPLGVAMQLPAGYEAHIVPRSSTFKNFGIIQTNHVGIVDNAYCGPNDWWYMPAYAMRDTVIHKNDRICQFRIVENQPKVCFEEVTQLISADRGGIGSTGVK